MAYLYKKILLLILEKENKIKNYSEIKCPYCSNKIVANLTFCPICGWKLNTELSLETDSNNNLNKKQTKFLSKNLCLEIIKIIFAIPVSLCLGILATFIQTFIALTFFNAHANSFSLNFMQSLIFLSASIETPKIFKLKCQKICQYIICGLLVLLFLLHMFYDFWIGLFSLFLVFWAVNEIRKDNL